MIEGNGDVIGVEADETLERRRALAVDRGERFGRGLGRLVGYTAILVLMVGLLVVWTAAVHCLVRLLVWVWGWSG